MLDILRKCETVPKKKLYLCINNTNGPSIISSKCVAYGTVASLCEFKPYGFAYFTYNNTIITTRFDFKELVIDGVLWATCLVKFIVHVGMQVFLEDFKHCGKKDYSYESRASIFTRIADCGHEPVKYEYKSQLPKHLKGSISVVGRNSFDKSYPQIGVATIDDKNEIFFINENSVFVNEVSMQHYQHVFPSNYFKFGMPVLLANPHKCHYTKTVQCANGDTVRINYVAHVVCVDENLCFVDMLRANGKINDKQTVTEIFEDAFSETGSEGSSKFMAALRAWKPVENEKAEEVRASTSLSMPVETITEFFDDALTKTGNEGCSKFMAALSAVEPIEVEKTEEIRASVSSSLPSLPLAISGNLNQETELNVTPQVYVNNTTGPRIIHPSSKAYATVESLYHPPLDFAYFTYNNKKVTARFKIKKLVIDDVPWNLAFARYVVHNGMQILLEDFHCCKNKTNSYSASGSINVSLSDCNPKCAPPLVSVSSKKHITGEICVVYRNGYDVAYPQVVIATVNGEKENIYIAESRIFLNKVHFTEYRHICPRDYFQVGMPVKLLNLQLCKQKSVKCENGDLFCNYVAQVVCFDKKLCFISLLRMDRIDKTQRTGVNVFEDASARSGNHVDGVHAAPDVVKPATGEAEKASCSKTVSPPVALHNQKHETELNIDPQVDVNHVPRPLVVSNTCVTYGKITSSLDEYNLCGRANFMYNNTQITTLYAINELFIDDKSWHKVFAKEVVRIGMPIILHDFQYYEKASSYVARGVISVKLNECRQDSYGAPLLTSVSRMNQPNGVIFTVGRNDFNVAYPQIVLAVIGGKIENIFVGDRLTCVNGVPLREYKYAFPAEYFEVGMPVFHSAPQKCYKKTVTHDNGFTTYCTFTAYVVRNDENLSFVDLLRASEKLL